MLDGVDRVAVIVKPKKKFVEWANSFADDAPEFPDQILESCSTCYLVNSPNIISDNKTILKKYSKEIFENELLAWSGDESKWPKKRDFKTFCEWFDASLTEMVFELEE